jgi:FSR family fosmidomycin resistance protein-like MFS transporter
MAGVSQLADDARADEPGDAHPGDHPVRPGEVFEEDHGVPASRPGDPAAGPDPATVPDSAPDGDPAVEPEGRADPLTVLTLSAAHFVHDSYPAFIGILLPLLIDRLDISLATAGLLASAIRWSTLTQPMVGVLADRRDTRAWAALAPATTAACICGLAFAPTTLVAAGLLLLAGLSHAAFHPSAGAMVTRVAGGHWGRATAVFMTGGEFGRAVGPLFIASVVAWVGLSGSWIAVIPGVVMATLVALRLRGRRAATTGRAPAHFREVVRSAGRSIWLLSGAIVLRGIATNGFITFYPLLVVTGGGDLLASGAVMAVYEVAGTIGALVGGVASDRLGRNPVIIAGTITGLPAMLAGLALGPTVPGALMLAVAGFCLLSGWSVQLVVMQEMLPDNRSAAVGLTYFMTTSGAILAMIGIGAAGQVVGLDMALPGAVLIGLTSVPLLAMMRPPARRMPPRRLPVRPG